MRWFVGCFAYGISFEMFLNSSWQKAWIDGMPLHPCYSVENGDDHERPLRCRSESS